MTLNSLTQLRQKTLWVARHGKSIRGIDDYGDAILTATLLPEAYGPLHRLAAYLEHVPTDGNWVSPIERCQQTARLISEKTAKQFITDSRITEYYQETFEEMVARVSNFLEELSAHEGQSFLLCTHGGVIAIIKHLYLDGKVDESQNLDYTMPGELMKLNNKKIEILSFNAEE